MVLGCLINQLGWQNHYIQEKRAPAATQSKIPEISFQFSENDPFHAARPSLDQYTISALIRQLRIRDISEHQTPPKPTRTLLTLPPAGQVFPSQRVPETQPETGLLKFCPSPLYNQQMSHNYELAITLNKLTLPARTNISRVAIAVQQDRLECFAQGGGLVKAGRVNFYRENLFLPLTGEPFDFILYGIGPEGVRERLASLSVDKKELSNIGRNASAFRSTAEGFQLSWQGWLFGEGLSSVDQCSERDYSELNLPFNGLDCSSNSALSALSQNSPSSRRQGRLQKRSSSTEETSSHGSKGFDSMASENKEEEGMQRPRQRVSQVTSLEKRHGHIRSQLYCSLITGISGLLSQKKLP